MVEFGTRSSSEHGFTILPGVSSAYLLERFRRAGGKEIESGKLASPESSACLASNCLAWFHDRPALLPPLPGLKQSFPAVSVDVEVQARFPWRGGRHPWLDAMVETSTHLIGIESKRYEPFRDKKTVSLSEAYDRPVWGGAMVPFERMRDDLRSGVAKFNHLDAAQLIKHAFGLVTQAAKRQKSPALIYLFAEPAKLGDRPISAAKFDEHRMEIARFAERVVGAEVAFAATSYRDWIASWEPAGVDVVQHGCAVIDTFGV